MPKQSQELRCVPVLHRSLDFFLEHLPERRKAQDKVPPLYMVLLMDPI
jgi:hypothetical protein